MKRAQNQAFFDVLRSAGQAMSFIVTRAIRYKHLCEYPKACFGPICQGLGLRGTSRQAWRQQGCPHIITWPLKYQTQAVRSCVATTDWSAMMDAICSMAQASCLRPTSPYIMSAPAAAFMTRKGRSAARKHNKSDPTTTCTLQRA